MTIALSHVNAIARDVAASVDAKLNVVGITSAEGSTAYSEIVIKITGCRREPCVVAIGIRRDVSEAALRSEIAEALHRHARDHSR